MQKQQLTKTVSLGSEHPSSASMFLEPQPWHRSATSSLVQDNVTFCPEGQGRSYSRLAVVTLAVLAVAGLTVGKYCDSSTLTSRTAVSREYKSRDQVTLADVTKRNGLCPCTVISR